jgi:SMODS and SLOG-associating 2TM effector domain 1
MSDRRTEVLDAYRRHRLISQEAFYAVRAARSAAARRWAVTFSAGLLVSAALFGALATADEPRRAMWAFVAASVSALATAITSYEAAFGFERLARQYDETRNALALANVFGPQASGLDQLASEAERDEATAAFVSETERLLRSEVETWSQQTATQLASEPPDHTG